MAISQELLVKAAKVYEAAESVEGMKPKQVFESHKKCAPGEFGMNKEGAEDNPAEKFDIYPDARNMTLPLSFGLGGAGLGAGAGALYGAATGGKGKRLRAALRGALGGALVGGGAGLGAGLAAKTQYPQPRKPTLEGAWEFMTTPADKLEETGHRLMYGVTPDELQKNVGNAMLAGGGAGLGLGALGALGASEATKDRSKKDDANESKAAAFGNLLGRELM